MEENWNVDGVKAVCSGCEKTLEAGDSLFSTLSFTGVDFERKNFCASCWETVRTEDLFSFWRTTVPEKEERRKVREVDVAALEELFERMLEEKDPAKEGLLFFVSILLVQKRVLKYREMKTVKGRRFLVLGRPRSKTVYEIADPGLDPEQMMDMRESLGEIL